jgi:hypothetical protein
MFKYIYTIYISNTVIFLYYAGDRKNLNRGKLLKHARPFDLIFSTVATVIGTLSVSLRQIHQTIDSC